MGMFDTVLIECPVCGTKTSYQSKIGECNLNTYTLHNAPLLVLADVKDECDRDRLYCEKCNTKILVEVEVRIRVITDEHHNEWIKK